MRCPVSATLVNSTAPTTRQVHERSAFFSPTEIGPLPDAKDHSVAYEDDSPIAHFCSGPREIKTMNYHALAGAALLVALIALAVALLK